MLVTKRKNVGNWISTYFLAILWKSIGPETIWLTTSSKCLLLCPTEERKPYTFVMIWLGVNADRIFIFYFLYTRSFLSHCGISTVNDCLLKWKRASGYHWWEIVAFHSCRLILNIKRSGIKWETKIKSGGKRKNKVSRCWDLVLNVQRVLGATDFSHLICGVVSSEYQSASSVSSTRSFIYQVQQ